MAGWSGGTFTRAHDWTDDEAGGVYGIEADRMDTEDDNFASGINACIHKGGQNAATANLPMGGFIHTNVGDASALTHYPSVKQVQNSAFQYAVSSGTDTVTLTLSPAMTAYAAGQHFIFKAGGTNTGATTLNVNGVGAKTVRAQDVGLTGAEILSGNIYIVVYDGTYFQLINPSRQNGAVGYRATQAISQGVSTAISFTGAEDGDYADNPIHSTVTNPSRFTAATDGFYICTCWAQFSGDADDQRVFWIAVNTTSKYITNPQLASGAATPVNATISGIVALSAGDYVEFYVSNATEGENVSYARGSIHMLSY